MYARTTTLTADTSRMDDGIRHVRDEVMPAVQSMPGCMGLSMLCDRRSGRCIVTTSWDSAESISASRDAVRAMRDQAMDRLGARDVTVDEWEIAAVHRAHRMGEGAWARLIYSHLPDPGQVDRILETWRTDILPRLDDYDGFASVSVMIDRSTGRGVSTVCFDSRDTLDRSREEATRMREEFSSRMGAEVTEVAEMELAIHHLRVPEMA